MRETRSAACCLCERASAPRDRRGAECVAPFISRKIGASRAVSALLASGAGTRGVPRWLNAEIYALGFSTSRARRSFGSAPLHALRFRRKRAFGALMGELRSGLACRPSSHHRRESGTVHTSAAVALCLIGKWFAWNALLSLHYAVKSQLFNLIVFPHCGVSSKSAWETGRSGRCAPIATRRVWLFGCMPGTAHKRNNKGKEEMERERARSPEIGFYVK
eukprot:IDg5657t1